MSAARVSGPGDPPLLLARTVFLSLTPSHTVAAPLPTDPPDPLLFGDCTLSRADLWLQRGHSPPFILLVLRTATFPAPIPQVGVGVGVGRDLLPSVFPPRPCCVVLSLDAEGFEFAYVVRCRFRFLSQLSLPK